jgi:CHAT domain-containing protein
MNRQFEEDKPFRRYLLGQLSEDEQESIECLLLSNEEAVEKLSAVEDDLIDSYIRRELNDAEHKQFEQNFFPVPERRRKLRLAKTLNAYLKAGAGVPEPVQERLSRPLLRRPARYLRAGVAALVVIGLAFGAWRLLSDQVELDKGLAALNSSYRDGRPLESRIDGFSYAPFSATRSGGPEKVDSLKRRLAERILIELAERKQSAPALHGLGKFFLAEKNFPEAIKQLELALKADPAAAQIRNDLGVALFEKGKIEADDPNSGQALVMFAKSLEHLNEALRLDESLIEARFNRALLYQQMRLSQQAIEDWEEYLRRDAASAWANEARQRRQAIEEQKRKVTQSKDTLNLEFLEAYKIGDHEKAWAIVSRNYDRAGNTVLEQLLDRYLEAVVHERNAAATEQLRLISYAGTLAQQQAGDQFISRLAEFYRDVTSQQRPALMRARSLMKSAHERSNQTKDQEAAQLFGQARLLFEQAGDHCEALFADYWLGLSHYFKHQNKQSFALQAQVARICEQKRYKWLQVRALRELSSLAFSFNEHSQAVDYAVKSLNIAQQIDDTIGSLNALSSLVEFQRYLGNQQLSLAYIQRSLPLLDLNPPNVVRDWRHYGFIALALSSFGYYVAALDYEKAALRVALPAGDVSELIVTYAWLGLIYGKLQDYPEALKNIRLGIEIAQRRAQEPAIQVLIAYSSLQLGHIQREMKSFDEAVSSYTHAIELYHKLNLQAHVYQAYKGRLLCRLAQGQEQMAKSELEKTLALAERYREKIIDDESRSSFFDVEQNVYDLAIDFANDRLKDSQKAFEYAEESKARSLLHLLKAGGHAAAPGLSKDAVSPSLSLAEIKKQLPKQVQLAQYAALEDKLLVWLISSDGIVTGEKKIAQNELEKKIQAYLQLVSGAAKGDNPNRLNAARELYDILIGPIKHGLAKDKTICFVPDKILNFLPYGSLISPESGKYLIEDFVVTTAPSSSVFINCTARADAQASIVEQLLSVGDPKFDEQAFPQLPRLKSARDEAAGIVAYYSSSQLLVENDATEERVRSAMAQANVIHLATHALVDERFPSRSKLLLTKGETSARLMTDGFLQASEVYQMQLPQTRLVILSACQTGVEHYYKGEGMIGLARPFLAAGVPLVIASLWPVDTEATAALMINFHRYRKQSGMPTAAALRKAQLDMLADARRASEHPYYWASFVTIGGHAGF